MPKDLHTAVLIAGPTASGKSALALDLARERGGMIINADSMQVYRDLRVLTARPTAEEESQVPHRLYGHVAADDAYSVSRWLSDVEAALDEAGRLRLCPMVVGGTGLYFKALTEGLSPVPAVPADVRARWRSEAERDSAGLYETLRGRDPIMASRLSPGDAQRITRALEVIDATGVSLAEWQGRPGRPLVAIDRCERMLVVRPRQDLHQRCDQRFDAMMAAGALDEVRALLKLGLPSELPVMRALGVPALAAHLAGRVSLDEAVAQAKTETRRYVKRQETWARKFMGGWAVISPK
jgi:tRNA dimethylallyltransferase